jgi:hypothetical protein
MVQYLAQPNWQRPHTPFRPVPGVEIAPGHYDYLRQSLILQSDPSAMVSGRFEGTVGGYFDGRLQTWRLAVQATPDPRIAVNGDYTVNRLSGLGVTRATLTTHLLGVETRLAASPRLQFVSFVQWNTVARQLSANARLAWAIPAPGASRQLLVKLTWLWQL